MVIVPLVSGLKTSASGNPSPFISFSSTPSRGDEARFNEACGLARAIELDVIAGHMVSVHQPRPATLLALGKLDEFKVQIEREYIDLVVIDHPLTPVQQRNLEKIWASKVIDRTGLILEIFGARARTREGVLQVELAHLNYQKGRLVRSWTHLERQRGGTGFLGGPGETQIEADRRILQSKISKIQKELEKVIKTRKLHRAKRKKIPYPVVALVGYTNAGKSTLFNLMTGAQTKAQDMLFATLDPALRSMSLPHGGTVILSDTVGFISSLPTHLVAAFRATLEEVIEADLILHVCAIAEPDYRAQHQDVMAILEDLGVHPEKTDHIIEVWNKIDRLETQEKVQFQNRVRDAACPAFMVSAITGEGMDALTLAIERHIAGQLKTRQIVLESHEMALLDWIYRHAGTRFNAGEEAPSLLKEPPVRRYDFDNGKVKLEFEMSDADWGRFVARREKTFSNFQ